MTEDTTLSKTPARKGDEAIDALEKLIQEIEESNPEELTEGQAAIVIRVARILITVIDQETPVWKSMEISGLLGKIKAVMEKLIVNMSKVGPPPEDEPSSVEEQILLDLKARRCDS